MLEPPAVFFDGRIEEADFRLPRLALHAEFVEGERAAEEGVDGGVDDVLGRDVREETSNEVLDGVGKVGGDARTGLARQPVDEVDLPLFSSQCHGSSCLVGDLRTRGSVSGG